jgi:predicted TIM-barrel fold metal-dependent hydrolase
MKFFDAHLHIIDPRFPLVPNDGYLPPAFTSGDYLGRMRAAGVVGGAVVSGSFQAFDQGYLRAALAELGPGFVGVTQLAQTVSDEEIISLEAAGVRAIRFNVRRGGSEGLHALEAMARRVYDVARWHVELYIDSRALAEIEPRLEALPAVSIDHLGLSRAGFDVLLRLAERGVRVKATGFSRVDFDVAPAMRELYDANPSCLMFGTDLPSTRAPTTYSAADLDLVLETFTPREAERVLFANAAAFYRSR